MFMNTQTIKIFFTLLFNVTSFAAISAAVEDDTTHYTQTGILDYPKFNTYINLKHEAYDFSVINLIDDFLAASWPTPTKLTQCPLNQTNEQELVGKLNQIVNALKNSSCSSDKESYFTSFDASVSKIGQFYYSGTNITNANPVIPNQQAVYYQNMNDMIGSLSNFSSDPKCAFDIKERGLIPVVSDVIGSASITALFIPNKYSLVAGTAGIAASASLKIIDSLLRPKFNMDKNDDRESFISIVCTFYELRAQIDSQKFMHIATDRDASHYQTALAFSTSIDSKLTILEAQKNLALQSLDEIRKLYVATHLSAEQKEFWEQLPQFKSRLASKDTASTVGFRLKLPLVLNRITQHLKDLNLENSDYVLYTNIEEDKKIFTDVFDPSRISQFNNQTDEQISEYFMKPLLRFEEIIKTEIMALEEDFEGYVIYEDFSFSALKMDIARVFDTKIDQLKESNNKINNYLNNIKKILDKKNFVDNDQGTHIDHLIIRFIKNIESELYGHVGWRFHEYMRNNAAEELREFFSHYKRFNRHFLGRAPIESESLRRTACATASDIILTINNSRSLVNMGADFIFSNRDFFHNNIPLIDLHWKFIPTGWSIESQFLVQAHSLIRAQASIKNNINYEFPRIISDKYTFSTPSLGDLMMGQIYADNRLEKLYYFKQINQCDR